MSYAQTAQTPLSSSLLMLQEVLAHERTSLVRFCAHLTGTPSAAEDLAQETLLEAWRNIHKFTLQSQPDSKELQTHLRKWLFAIARNVCLRWGRAHHHDLAHVIPFAQYASSSEETGDVEETLTDPCDVEIEQERDELARLLDRALALLPPVTRDVLIERYIHKSPYAEIAERLGLSEEALAQRLRRGKLALRRLLSNDLQAEAEIHFPQANGGQEQETGVWCPMCNSARLIKYIAEHSSVGFQCPTCWHIAVFHKPEIWAGLRSPKAILNRQIQTLGQYYWQNIYADQPTCQFCQSPARVQVVQAQDLPERCYMRSLIPYTSIYIACTRCSYEEFNPLPHLTLDIPETSQFWRKHPRMRWLSAQEIDHGGVPAFVSSFQSATDSARLDVIIQRSTLHVLGIYQA
jgi:RNA polymerase sigma factor (sigma-70 family)